MDEYRESEWWSQSANQKVKTDLRYEEAIFTNMWTKMFTLIVFL